jgi:RNA polymerase-interacting CarD/CdnL/TRCF family regulator
MFKKEEIVIYPQLGATKINQIYKEQIDGQDEYYYELLYKENLKLSVPVNKADELGLRYPMEKQALEEALKGLNQKFVPTGEVKEYSIDNLNRFLLSGTIEDAILLINTFKWLIKEKAIKLKKLEISQREVYRKAINFIESEIKVVLGPDALEKYKL